jgi:VWFA-related protein
MMSRPFPSLPPIAPVLALVLLSVALLPPVPADAQETAAEVDRTFTGETTVTVVEVPVRVLANGEPVTGLEADDFRIFDDGEERRVLSVERVDLRESRVVGEAGAGAAEPSPAARRHFLLLFDMAFTDGEYLERAVEAARDLVRDGLHESDLVGVAVFNLRAGVSEVVGFTPDHDQALRALDELAAFLGEGDGATRSAEGGDAPDPLRLRVGDWEARLADVGVAAERTRSGGEDALEILGANAAGGGRGGDLGGIEAMVEIGAVDMAQVRATEASALVTSLGDLADSMRWVEGAKYLVLFSRGFESTTYQEEAGAWLLGEMNRTVEKFRQAGWSIHSIETTGQLATGNRRARREALFLLAEDTGGALIENENDLSRAMGDVLEQTSVSYLLTFESPELPADGAFRDLRVELATGSGAPDGARVFHRAGYFAPKPFGEMDQEERRMATAELLLAGREVDEIGCRVLVSPAEVLAGGGMRVPVVLDVDAVSLLAARNWQATRVQALAYAFDEAGRVAGSWGRDFFLTPGVVMKASEAGGLVFYGELELPPGSYEVRSLLRSVEDGRVTLRSSDLRIPGRGGEGTILEPIFAEITKEGTEESANRIMIRDASSGAGYPFVLGERRFLPALAPTVVRGTETAVVGRGLWPTPPAGLRALVFDANGFPVPGGIAVRLLGVTPGGEGPDGAGVGQVALGLEPTGLPPGDYQLRLVTRGADGSTRSSPPASFRVVESSSEVR